MLNLLLGSPVLLFLALLPVCLLAALLARATGFETRLAVPLGWAALLLLGAMVAGHLGFALYYSLSPNFSDHIEPNTAVVAWLWANGGQIYHPLDGPDRYAFLYGPLAYLATGAVYQLAGASTFTAKLVGILCLLLTLLATALAVRRRFPAVWYPVLVALGYVSLLALFFKNFSFWSKPDSLMLAASAVGLLACLVGTRQRPRELLAWTLCGVALGVAGGAKITGVLYFLPYVAWFLQRDGVRAPLVIGTVALVVMAVPFAVPESVSLVNYLAWLQAAGGHGLSRSMFIQNAFFAVFALLPVVVLLLRKPALVWQYKWVAAASLAAYGLVLIAASKPGSGPHHFLPFLPALGMLAAVAAVESCQDKAGNLYFMRAPLAAFLLAAGVKASLALYYGVPVVSSQYAATELVAELDEVAAAYPDRSLNMGYGDGSRYTSTFVRNHLVYAGNPYLVDASAIMDFQLSGIALPQSTIDALLADTAAVWLVPKDQQPFTLVSWYFRDTDGMVFDANFRAAFAANFRKDTSTVHYDVYVRQAASL